MARIAPLNIDWKPDRTTGEPVTEQIVGYMCEQVHSGNWPIGSRLPSQRALAEWFGVNRSTVIAAINELSDYGIVEGQHGAGTRIVSNRWSLMLPGAPDWADYVDSGFFKANNDTIQAINRYEFTPNMTRIGTGELAPRLFPKAMWRQVLGEAADAIATLGYPPPEGLPELREAIARNVAKDLGDIALPLLPIGLQPFAVAEFFPTPGLSEYYDPRQHAIALCYVVPIAGDCKPQDETLDVEWVDPKSDVMDTFVAQMVNGHGRIVRQALAWAGI